MGRWYCCNDSYVTLSTLQEVLSEKAYILFFTRTGQKPVCADTAAVSNGVKPHEINGSNMFKSPRSSIPVKAMNMKSSNSPSLIKGIPAASKNKDASSILQTKFSGIANSLVTRVSGSTNGKTDVQKREPVQSNGSVGHSFCNQMNGNNIHPLQDNNGDCKNGEHNAVANRKVLVNGDAHANNGTFGPEKGSFHEDNGLKEKEGPGKMLDNGSIHNGQSNECIGVSGFTRKPENRGDVGKMLDKGAINNGQSHKCFDVSGFKRKLEDRGSCILLAKDAQSRARVEEFKEAYVLITMLSFLSLQNHL